MKKTITSCILFLVMYSVSSQETLQSVTENGSVTDRRVGFYAGGSVANNNFIVDGLTMGYKDPLVIKRNMDYLGLALNTAAIRFDIDHDALDQAPSSLIFMYPDSGIPYLRRIGNDHTIFKIWSPRDADNAYESTLALVNGDGEEEILDLYNMSYPSNHSFGLRMQKRGTGAYKPFHFEYSDGNETYPVFTMKPDKSSYFYGNLCIGTEDHKGYQLAVAGDMVSESVTVKLKNNWPDYVFEEDYKLQPLEELEHYIRSNRKLPEIPSAEEVEEKGVDLGEINRRLLEKIEELTLYVIDQNKSIKQLQEEVKILKQAAEKNKNYGR
ncbi:hypothetical protein LS482_09675 [Sinomicrobium kalidii]|uniref:hypothetical protein n=1 Tax=Sinomicrobium kalidii TaxID=2900738 RepID=UPI001E2853BA|nr:hypothetical protein [Sinomicrobium kalidii]UGU18136.1 hypothetical protein LS482_09675 [Sinomicrobium kalidii]